MTWLQSLKYYHWEKAFNSGGLFNPVDRQNETQWMEDEGEQTQSRNRVLFFFETLKAISH